jgi:hypothetical protein
MVMLVVMVGNGLLEGVFQGEHAILIQSHRVGAEALPCRVAPGANVADGQAISMAPAACVII